MTIVPAKRRKRVSPAMPSTATRRVPAQAPAIAATPGVDVLWLGHFDLTNFMGIPAQFQHPDFIGALRAVTAAARRHGKQAGIQARARRLAGCDCFRTFSSQIDFVGMMSELDRRSFEHKLAKCEASCRR